MLTAGFRWAPDTLPMNKMMAMTINAGATTAAVRLIMPGKAWPIMPPPAATSTRKNVPSSSEKRRRHSWRGSLKSAMRSMTPCSYRASGPGPGGGVPGPGVLVGGSCCVVICLLTWGRV